MKNNTIKISFVLTTYNKINYLKVTLPYVLDQLREEDEELIIVDGASTDGSREFISLMVQNRQQTYFVSEKDRGEADGLNKALAMCKGKVIKNLTDDDAFSFASVRIAADHLLSSDLDIMGFNGFGLTLFDSKPVFSTSEFTKNYLSYLQSKKPFFFCGLSYLFKTESLSKLGYFSTDFKMVDLEYSFRISAKNCKIGWSNLWMFVNIYNANSNTLVLNKRLEKESIALHRKYCSFNRYIEVLFRFKLQRILEFKNKLIKKERYGAENKLSFEDGFLRSVSLLEKENNQLKEILFYP